MRMRIYLSLSIHNISGKYGHFWIWEDFSSSLSGEILEVLSPYPLSFVPTVESKRLGDEACHTW